MMIKKVLVWIVLNLIVSFVTKAQSNQQKAQDLVQQYLRSQTKNLQTKFNLKFDAIKILRSSYDYTKPYQNLLHKVDSLKKEGRRIDAHIAHMKTNAELDQAKKDSYRLSKELTEASNQLVDFIASYKGQPKGWLLKCTIPQKTKPGNFTSKQKTFYLNQALSKVDSVGR